MKVPNAEKCVIVPQEEWDRLMATVSLYEDIEEYLTGPIWVAAGDFAASLFDPELGGRDSGHMSWIIASTYKHAKEVLVR